MLLSAQALTPSLQTKAENSKCINLQSMLKMVLSADSVKEILYPASL